MKSTFVDRGLGLLCKFWLTKPAYWFRCLLTSTFAVNHKDQKRTPFEVQLVPHSRRLPCIVARYYPIVFFCKPQSQYVCFRMRNKSTTYRKRWRELCISIYFARGISGENKIASSPRRGGVKRARDTLRDTLSPSVEYNIIIQPESLRIINYQPLPHFDPSWVLDFDISSDVIVQLFAWAP